MFGVPGLPEMLIVAAIMLLLFGKRLPEVARSLGRSLTEFKRGVRGIEHDVERGTDARPVSTPQPDTADDLADVSRPNFEPST